MAFIVKKKVNGKDYFYLNENKRIEGKVKTKTLAYLGKTKKQAEKKAHEIMKKMDNKTNTKEKQKFKTNPPTSISVEDMAIFCKRKGFVYQSGEIYGGFAGFWDFGVLGAELKNNIKKEWWKFHVWQRRDVKGIDGSIITNPKVWEASGHVGHFVDVAVINKKTKEKFKIDKHEIKNYANNSNYEIKGEFNPMFTTQVGPVINDSIKAYLRPETAQLIFTNFKSVYENERMKLPCGIAQIGKAFRNEIAPRDFLFRCREFEQMEIEYFVNPEEKMPYEIPDVDILIYSEEMQNKKQEMEKMKIKKAFEKGIIKTNWHAYWLAKEYDWFVLLGANPQKFRLRQHVSDEKSHYSSDTWDLEYNFPFGWKELLGMANRGNYDLKQHEKFSKKDLKIMDEKTGKKILPHVICEPSLGVERAFLVFMFDSYFYDEERKNIVLHLHPKIAPIKAAIFPIVKRPELEKIAVNVFDILKKEWNVVYDESGSIGRRYSRNDEIGTPFCITIDEESIKKNDVTIRERNTKKQIRVKISELKEILKELINNELEFVKAGKLIT